MEEQTFDDVIALYYSEWVLYRITAFDENHRPARGIVLGHSHDRAALHEILKQQPPTPEGAPYQPYYTFKAHIRVRRGETFDEAAERFDATRAALLEAPSAAGQ